MIEKDTQVVANKSLIETGAEAGMKKAGEAAFSRVINGIIDGIVHIYGDARVRLGNLFVRYIHNATERYNQVKTLATGNSPRTILGSDSIYVNVGLRYKGKTIGTETIDNLLRINKHLLIEGTGGIGKTMLMRYLFLNTAHLGRYVPVLLDLRKIIKLPVEKISILELIYTCLNDLDIDLPKEQFEYSLQLGKYCFLMDGFDEIVECLSGEAAEAIQQFCSKYPKNPCIVTSRPRKATRHLQTFVYLESCPLNKQQAVTLASKLWKEDEKTKAFCKQLEEHLFNEHKDFAENPLLLSMMFLTFMRNNSVPTHLVEFYDSAYDALYNNHDSHNKGGYYVREFCCKSLDKMGFKQILMHFCFHTYFKEIYEFRKAEIIAYINKAIQKFNYRSVCAEDYLQDLQEVVCLIVEEGGIYRFSHRSFQTYFAATYTNLLSDEDQKKIYKKIFDEKRIECELFELWDGDISPYFTIMWQLNPWRFALNAIEEPLRAIHNEISQQKDPSIYLMKNYMKYGITMFDVGTSIYYYTAISRMAVCIFLFTSYIKPISTMKNGSSVERLRENEHFREVTDKYISSTFDFSKMDRMKMVSEEEREFFYDALADVLNIRVLCDAIDQWLREIDKQRLHTQVNCFFDDL